MLNSEQSLDVVKPHFGTLQRIMNETLEDVNKALGTLVETPNNRAKFSLIHSIAIEKAKKYFDKVKDVFIVSKYQSIQIIFSNKIVARIKKVNKDNISANAKSGRNDAILMQQTSLFSDLLIEDVSPSTFVDLGYRINQTGDQFENLNVICRRLNTVEWHFSFKSEESIIVLDNPQEDSLNVKEEKTIKIKKAK